MNFHEVLLLGFIQGLTEFLPVSSSAHLVIFQKILGFEEPPVFFDILVHCGTLLAIIIFFKKELRDILIKTVKAILSGKIKRIPLIVWFVIIGTVPAVIFGLVLNKFIEIIFNSLLIVGLGLMITSILLFFTSTIENDDKIKPLTNFKALLVGLFQALAILPGVSRSGSTVSVGVLIGLRRKEAFNFSFYLAIPAILGALILQTGNLANLEYDFLSGLTGLLTAFFCGLLSLKLFRIFFLKGRMFYFAAYCCFLSVASLSFYFFSL